MYSRKDAAVKNVADARRPGGPPLVLGATGQGGAGNDWTVLLRDLIGLNIKLPFEQGANPYITDGLLFEFHYFFMRQFWFAYLAKSLVVFPGGFSTLDEMS